MRFPKVKRGIAKIYLAEILSLVAIIPSTIVMFIPASSKDMLKGDTVTQTAPGVIVIICSVLALLLFIGSAVLGLMGYASAAKEEGNFRNAFFLIIAGAVFMLVANILQSAGVPGFIPYFFTSLSQLMDLMVTVFTILGLIRLSVLYNDVRMIQKGTALYKLLIFIYVPAVIAHFLASLFSGSVVTALLVAILIIASMILSIVYSVLYMVYLYKANEMLEE